MEIDHHPNIICIAGSIASGKTYVSSVLANRNNWHYCSTGDFLREILNKDFKPPLTREQLQKTGEYEISKGWKTFANNFLNYAKEQNSGDCLIVDGVRHIEFYNEIINIVFPKKCLLIYLDIQNEIIQQRLQERGETQINFNHLSEGNQSRLMSAADYISDGNIDNVENYIKSNLY